MLQGKASVYQDYETVPTGPCGGSGQWDRMEGCPGVLGADVTRADGGDPAWVGDEGRAPDGLLPPLSLPCL